MYEANTPTPPNVRTRLDVLARERAGDLYLEEEGIVRFPEPQKLRGALAGNPIDLLQGRVQLLGSTDSEMHATHFCLVRNVGIEHLHDDRLVEQLERGDRLLPVPARTRAG